MPFDFPNSPTYGQSVSGPNGSVYMWDGVKWVASSTAVVTNPISSIYLMTYLPGLSSPNGVNCVSAMQQCIAQATANAAAGTASVIILPVGQIDLSGASSLAGLAFGVPDMTTICGQGREKTNIIWPDQQLNNHSLFGRQASGTQAQSIALERFSITGGWTDDGGAGTPIAGAATTSSYPFIFFNVNDLRFNDVGVYGSTSMGMVVEQCRYVEITGCELKYIASDGFHVSGCARVRVTNNRLMWGSDDCIAIWSNIYAVDGVPTEAIVTDNFIFNYQGMSFGSPGNTLIANNVFDLASSHGITINTAVPDGNASNDSGFSWMHGVTISNNVFRNCWDEGQVPGGFNVRSGCTVIGIYSYAARKGGASAVPGEADGTGAIVPLRAYFRSNANDTSATISGTATAGGRQISIINNLVERTLPPCDGSYRATATGGRQVPGTGGTWGAYEVYTKFSDYGIGGPSTANVAGTPGSTNGGDPVSQGRLWMQGNISGQKKVGWVNPVLADAAFRPQGIEITGVGPLHNILVDGNAVNHVLTALSVDAQWFTGLRIQGNFFSEFFQGIILNPRTPKGPCSAEIAGNTFDGDPLFASTLRTVLPGTGVGAIPPKFDGTWQANAFHIAIDVQSGGAFISAFVHENTVRNCAQVFADNSAGGNMESRNNYQEYLPPSPTTVDVQNRGIQQPALDGWLTRVVDSDPRSTTYGQALGTSLSSSGRLTPTTGWYPPGYFVRNSFPQIDGDGNTVFGWFARQGSYNPAGIAWSPLYSFTSPMDFTALANPGVSNGVVSSIAATGDLFFYNSGTDPWPTITLSAPPSGGVQATAHIGALSPANPVFPSTTITPTSTLSVPGGSLTLLVNQGTSLVSGQTLTEQSGLGIPPQTLVVLSTDTLGHATALQWVDDSAGNYTAYPPAPAHFSGGVQVQMPSWRLNDLTDLTVDNGGFYKTVRPTVTLAPVNVLSNTVLFTAKMGQAIHSDYTGMTITPPATLNVSGAATFTGPVTLPGTATGGSWLPLTGGTVVGNLTLNAGQFTASYTNTQPTSDFIYNLFTNTVAYTANGTGGDSLGLFSYMEVRANGFSVPGTASQHTSAIYGNGFLVNDGNAASNIAWINGGMFVAGNQGPGTVQNAVAVRGHPNFNSGGGTLTNYYFLYEEPSTAAQHHYNYLSSPIGLGTTGPSYNLDINCPAAGNISTTNGLRVNFSGSTGNLLVTATGTTLFPGYGGGAGYFGAPSIIVGAGTADLTTATTNMLYISSCAGPPTGTPAQAALGRIPMRYDTTNNKLWLYDGGWFATPIAFTTAGGYALTDPLTVGSAAGAPTITYAGPSGSSRFVAYTSADKTPAVRWQVGADGAAETGTSDTGSNFEIRSFSDAGTLTATTLINRHTGGWTMPANVTVTAGGLTVSAGTAQFSGGVGIGTATASVNTVINGPASSARAFFWQTAGSTRWNIQTVGTETGTLNAGADMQIRSYDDTGTFLTTALQLTRATGAVLMPALQASTSYANDAAAAAGGVNLGQLYRNGSAVQIRVA